MNPTTTLSTATVCHGMSCVGPRARHTDLRGAAGIALRTFVRWCTRVFERPVYYRLGAFDLARSPWAREMLARLHP